ncbi:MAG: relaxase domain-containing protein, partial [Alphaproteobacteria bacterium]|nr:relaxase domain-containing protein [Alphaproteobacteria bacterium]
EALVAGDRRVIRAHDDAVRATLDWIEAELLETRGWDSVTRRRPRVKADGMAVAGFRHLTSRDLDPQLHTHCVLANMTRTRDGAWRSVEPTRIRRSRNLIGAHYRNELARRLQAMGMATAPTMVGNVPGFELAGYDRSFLMAFSGRRREILAHLERLGLPYTPALAQMAALHTRRRKRDRSLAELVPEWRERARALGLSRDRMALAPPRPVDPDTGAISDAVAVPPPDLPDNVIRNRKRAPALPELPRGARAPRKGRRTGRPSAPARLSREPETGPLEAVARAVAHAEERRTVIPETEIRAVALGHAPGRWTLAEIDAAVARLVREGELVETVRRGADRAFVTDRAVKAERRLLAIWREGRGRAVPLADEASVAARLEGGRLTEGQRAAVRTLLLAEDAIVGVQGHAGSGKTAMLREAASLAGERRILGLAPSAAAARVLAREAGVEAWTLQRFLVRHGDLSDPDRLARAREEFGGALLAVDEASMIDTARMEALLRISRTLGVARVALVGDTAQLRAVDAGQPFRLLQRAGMETAVMDEVLRQRDPALLEAVRRSREGAPGAATEILGERVREVPRGDLGAEAGRRWLALGQEARADTAIMAPTHAIRREVNAAVREGLAAEGALQGPSLVIDRLVDRRLTRAQAADIRSWEEGDTVVFHRDAYGCRQDDVCIVTAVGDGRVVLATPGGERSFRPSGNSAWWCRLHDTEEIEIRAGDRIRWTRNRKASRGRPGLVNGGEAEVVAIGRSRVRFRDPDGRGFSLARDDVQLRHLDHAYCTTVHAAQGATARSAIAVLDSAGAVDQALFHVELSRASEDFLLLTDDREGLVEALEGRPGQDGGALEALGIDPERPPVVDPETFAALVADWRDLERRREETGRDPFGLPGHAEVMARAAALSAIEDLSPDMRRTLDTMLEGHGRRIVEERKARDLAARVRAHWRMWPELGWAASAAGRHPEDMPGHAAWRREGDALLDEARATLDGPRRHERPDRESAPGEAGIRTEAAALERTRTLDDSGRFRRGWRALQDRARRDSVPELHCEGWEGTARLGERLDGQ